MTKPVPPTWLADALGSGRQTDETQGRWPHVLVVAPVIEILPLAARSAVREVATQRQQGVFR